MKTAHAGTRVCNQCGRTINRDLKPDEAFLCGYCKSRDSNLTKATVINAKHRRRVRPSRERGDD